VRNIFVGNLDAGTTVATIRSVFETHGKVQTLKLMTDRETGLSRGFAFVEMMEPEAEHAIAALNGSTLDGRTVQVRPGRPKLHIGGALRVPRV
jgi:cold-inducible RNA-binding protein